MTRRHAQPGFDAIAIEGGLLTPDFLLVVADLKAPGQTPTDYRVPRGIQVRDEIGRSWRIAEAHWADVEAAIESGGPVDVPMRAVLREAFGWASLASAHSPSVIDGHAFPISAFAVNGMVPVVFGAVSSDLDKPLVNYGDGQKRRSAFGLLQEYLNATPTTLWGIAANGVSLRITRDNASLTRPSWIEADLARIMREERYADFSVLWLLLHETRFGSPDMPARECVLEQWRAAAATAGTAARERLRDGVEAALRELGNGFLQHPANAMLRSRLQSGSLDSAGYQQQLLRFVYRIIFLLVAEERELLHQDGSDRAARDLYREGYSLRRLRERAARRRAYDRHEDIWSGFSVVLRACARGDPRLAIPPLGGLFAVNQTPDLDAARITNAFLLAAIYRLTWLEERDALVRVNWRDMGTEELGSVYESLLELVPVVRADVRHFGFVGDTLQGETGTDAPARGHARKLTGSYYTPDSLVQALLDSALEPILQRAESATEPDRAILSLAILDPACGSGHFLLGAARRLASRLARIRSEGTPSPAAYRAALRDVITHCTYGVDKNAMAIELARIALWLEAIDPGQPLAFLDHHLVHGDAILGVIDPALLGQGIPEEAYSPLTGDEKSISKALRKQNEKSRKELDGERTSGQFVLSFATDEWARGLADVDAMPDGSLAEFAAKEAALRAMLESDANRSRFAQDAYVAAFLLRKTADTKGSIPTTGALRNLAIGVNPSATVVAAVDEIARSTPFLHWSIAFAPVMARGGFDCVIGNPPWEKVTLNDKEFFEIRAPDIANAPNGAARLRLIEALATEQVGTPGWALYEAYVEASHCSEATSRFAHDGGRFPLTGTGIVNLYALFAELALGLLSRDGRAGLVLPSGIASDSGTSAFFREIANGRLVSLIDFENREGLFPAVDSRMKFCLLTIGRATEPVFAFFLTSAEQRFDDRRRFTLTSDDLRRLNPNTETAPIFRSRADAELTARIYRNVTILWDETREDGNPWGVQFRQGLFNMSADSHLFSTKPGPRLLPLYEAKMIHQFDHRYATYTGNADETTREVTEDEKQDPEFRVRPRYWVPFEEVEARLQERAWGRPWLLGWRRICRATDERTVIASVLPRAGTADTAALMFPAGERNAFAALLLLGDQNSLVHDYVARHKVGGTHLDFHQKRQITTLAPTAYSPDALKILVPRLAQLVGASAELSEFVRTALAESGIECLLAVPGLEPDRRAEVRAEVDATYASLYGLSRSDLDFVLDPAATRGDGYPTETFRVLKDGELRRLGEYRTRRLVLEAWDRLIGAG